MNENYIKGGTGQGDPPPPPPGDPPPEDEFGGS